MNGNTPFRTTRGHRLLNLASGKNDWYRIRNATDTQVATVHIYDEIGYFGVSADDFIRDMADVTGPVRVHLNSPGGEVSDGITIYNALEALDDVEINIDGMAASIASVIAMAASPGKLRISPHAQVMVHNPYTMAVGDADDLRELADRLDTNAEIISGIYASRTSQPASHWKAVMKATTWYTGQEAVDAGLCDMLIPSRKDRTEGAAAEAVSNSAAIPVNKFDTSVFRPGVMAAKANTEPVKDAAHQPYQGQYETSHAPVSGVHSHNHAAFGHSDGDDGIHAHSHHHNNDGVHEHVHMTHGHDHDHEHPHEHAHDAGQHRYGSHEHYHTHHVSDDHDGDVDDGHGRGDTDHDYFAAVRHHIMNSADPTSVHVMDASYDDSAWDGGAAMKAAGSASDFRAICAGRRDGPGDERGSWALPHHKHPGSPPNRAGVTAALGRLAGTEGLTNKSAAEAHLKAHQKAWASEASDSAGDYTEEDARLFAQLMKGSI